MNGTNVTEEDVLRGEKEITVRTRDGRDERVLVRKMSWPLACKVSAMFDAGEAMIHTIVNCVPPDKATDDFLGAMTPVSLTEICTTAMQLTNGIDGLKKAAAAGKNGPAQGTPISSPPATI